MLRLVDAPTIGELEKLAGVTDREAFWEEIAKHDFINGLNVGVLALRRMASERQAE